MPELERLGPRLHRLADTCNVYVVTAGNAALIVDSGSGAVAEVAGEVGVDTIEWVLHTHGHRDQCTGTPRLRELGARVAVPTHERRLFEEAELHWRTRRIFDNYDDRNTFLAPTRDIPVDAELVDYEAFRWRDLSFDVLPAKGHTAGSSMLVVELDGRRVAFVGDLLTAGGVLYQLHAMEYEYGAMEGVLFTLESLAELRGQDVDLVLPSHGDPVTDVAGDLDRLTASLAESLELGEELGVAGWKSDTPATRFLPEQRLVELSPHLLWSGSWTCANFYVVLDGEGRALLVDYGHSAWAHLHTGADHHGQESMRFVRHHLTQLRRDHGVESIDVVVPTHIHDDHTCGIPYLQRHEGTQCWALDAVARVLEDPAAWASAPCVYPEPIRIDRRLADGDRFAWGGHEFELRFAPGQTEFASVLAATIDDRRVAFTGDNLFLTLDGRPFETTVLRNSFQPWMHRRCVDVMRDLEPELVCPGHGEVIPWSRELQDGYAAFVERKEALFDRLVGAGGDPAIDLFWARLVPYVTVTSPEETVVHRLLLRNNYGHAITVSARLLPAEGWSATEPDGARELRLDPGGSGELELASVAPALPHARRALTVELTVDGEPRGPVVEALVATRQAGTRPA